MGKRIVDLVFTTVVLIGTVYLWQVADSFPTFAKYRNVDSAFWPKIILVCMGILSFVILFENIAALRLQIGKERSSAADSRGTADVNWRKMILMGLLCVAYYFALHLIGFVLATIVFMWLAMAVIGGAKKIMMAVFPLIFTIVLAVVFVKFLELSLPRGMGIFHELSLFLY
jgi:hypothetical protein